MKCKYLAHQLKSRFASWDLHFLIAICRTLEAEIGTQPAAVFGISKTISRQFSHVRDDGWQRAGEQWTRQRVYERPDGLNQDQIDWRSVGLSPSFTTGPASVKKQGTVPPGFCLGIRKLGTLKR